LVRDGAEIDAATAEGPDGVTVEALFDRTPFYAESGGQASDAGELDWSSGQGALVALHKHAGDLFVHTVHITSGALSIGDRVRLAIDTDARTRTRANHSAAHLVHAALKNVLGGHVAQKGQLVDSERMRFDFSHGQALSAEELERVEAEVNAVIRQNLPAETRSMTPQAAIDAGAVALFGEKYGEEVRVLTLGRALKGEGAYSVELCGGTHVARTGDIALFKIIAESGVAAGVRRVEALTGEAARRFLLDRAGVAEDLGVQFKVPPAEVPARVQALIAERKALEKALADAKRKLALGGGGAAPAEEEINGVKFIGRVLDGVDGKGLRPVIEDFRKQIGSGVVAVIGVSDGRCAIAIAVTPDLTTRFSAADLIRRAVPAMGGQGGGGKPDFAQGGAPDGALAEAGLEAVRAALG
jgi:alanyl-tRNA synthetase